MSSNFISANLHKIVGCLLLRWSKNLAASSLRRYGTANNAEHLIISTKINLYPQSIKWNNFGKFSHKFYLRSFTFLIYLNADLQGYFRLKLSRTSGGCPRWRSLSKDLLYQNTCKEAMNIGVGQTKSVLFNFYVFKKCPFLYPRTLPSVSKTISGFTKQSRLSLPDNTRKYDFKCCPINGVFDGKEKVGQISKSVA